jgi:hypothetical protein
MLATMGGGSMHNLPIPRACLTVLALAVACAVLAAPSAAIVPPTDCGVIHVKGKPYDVKVDQLRCRTVKPWVTRYLSVHRRPSGYTCHDFGKETKLKFRCSRGIKVFFAIRR